MICYTAAVYFDFHFSFCLIFLVMFLFGCCQNFGCVLARAGDGRRNWIPFILIIILTLKLTPRFGNRLNLIQVSIFYSFMSIGRKLAQQTMQALKFENKRMLPSTVSVICVDSTRRLCQQIASKSVLNYSSEIDILMISFSSNRTDRPTPPTTVNRVSILFLRDRIFTNRF